MKRWWPAAALSLLMAASPAGAQPPDERPIEPDAYRRASDALVGRLFPDARRDWKTGEITFSDGRVQKIRLTGLTWAARPGGLWILSGVEFPDALDEQMKRLAAPGRPSERQAARLVVAKADAQFAIAEHRLFDIDSESPVSRLVSLGAPELPRDAEGWPKLGVRGASAAFVAGGATVVWWDGELDVASGTWSKRAPAQFWRKEADGTEKRDYLVPGSAAEGQAQLRAATSPLVAAFACRPPCDIRPFAAIEVITAALRAAAAP